GVAQSVDDPRPAPPPAPPVTDAEPEPTVETKRRTEPDAALEDHGDDERKQEPFRLGDLTPFLLVRAAHPRQALVTSLGVPVAAALAGRPSRELLLVLATVLVGQVILGWFNDLVDRERDARHHRTGKPLADGRLDP